jgi:hypothetical protein
MHEGFGIDVFSSVPLYLVTKVNGHKLADATGFLWLLGDRHYLVTNWHVLSGRHPENGECLHSKGGIPDEISVFFPQLELTHEPIEVQVLLFDGQNQLWIEHPRLGSAADIAAIQIDVPPLDQANYFPINAVKEVRLKQRVGLPVFVVGFPFGRQFFGMPIWKKASFASEPSLASISDNYILVDSASRPGMSGSPVIQREFGQVELENGQFGRVQFGDGAGRLVGVYAGRCHTNDPNDAQLGRVWPIRLVRELLDDQLPTLDHFF